MRFEGMSTRALLERLWTKSVGTRDYDKEEWRELERRLPGADEPKPEQESHGRPSE